MRIANLLLALQRARRIKRIKAASAALNDFHAQFRLDEVAGNAYITYRGVGICRLPKGCSMDDALETLHSIRWNASLYEKLKHPTSNERIS